MNRQEPSLFGNIKNAVFGTTAKASNVDGVLEVFRTTIAELRDVGAAHSEKASAHAEQIAQLTAAKEAATAEAVRAATIASKMEAIFQ